DVEAGVGLDRPGDLLLDRSEHRAVELGVLLALGDAEQLAALLLGGWIVREILGDLRPLLARLDAALGLQRVGLLLGQDDLEVAALGLRELLLVLLVVVLDL